MEFMRIIALLPALCSLLVVNVAAGAETKTIQLDGGLESRDVLIQRFVTALEEKDKEALMGLLVSTEQYRDHFIPTTVEPGQPPRQWPEKPRQFFTDNFFHKSSLYADNLLDAWGGRKITINRTYFTRDTREYAGYIAHGELRLDVTVDPPVDFKPIIRAGFIAEVGGRFGFIGFLYDDD